MLGNVKNAMHGTYHALRPKYLQRYLAKFCYRLNRRFDLATLVPRLIVAAGRTPPLTYLPRNLGCVWWGIRRTLESCSVADGEQFLQNLPRRCCRSEVTRLELTG